MASSDRSIASHLPQWMKTKMDKFDFDHGAFSPPTDDDGFFIYRYRKPVKSLSEEANSSSMTQKSLETSSSVDSPTVNKPKIIDGRFIHQNSSAHMGFQTIQEDSVTTSSPELKHHTASCQQFIPNAKITPREIGMKNGVDPPLGRLKSTGTDDGFSKEGAACGYSVVAVAHQMIAEHGHDKVAIPPSQRVRRNSKSLPTSPMSSPKLLKRNPYFTHIFFGSTERINADTNNSVSSAFNSSTEDNSTPTESLTAKVVRALSDSESSHAMSEVVNKNAGVKTLKARPSELREMNFWSPTSM